MHGFDAAPRPPEERDAHPAAAAMLAQALWTGQGVWRTVRWTTEDIMAQQLAQLLTTAANRESSPVAAG